VVGVNHWIVIGIVWAIMVLVLMGVEKKK